VDFKERLEIAYEVMIAKGVPDPSQDGLMHMLLRRVGIDVPPPCFCSFEVNLATAAVPFALIMGIINWMIVESSDNQWILKVIEKPMYGGVAVGVLIAALARRTKRKHELPDWPDLERPTNIFD
jgi:hypothetical protein